MLNAKWEYKYYGGGGTRVTRQLYHGEMNLMKIAIILKI